MVFNTLIHYRLLLDQETQSYYTSTWPKNTTMWEWKAWQ